MCNVVSCTQTKTHEPLEKNIMCKVVIFDFGYIHSIRSFKNSIFNPRVIRATKAKSRSIGRVTEMKVNVNEHHLT